MISYASMLSLADDRFDDFDDDFEDDNMAKRRSGASFGSFRGSIGILLNVYQNCLAPLFLHYPDSQVLITRYFCQNEAPVKVDTGFWCILGNMTMQRKL